MGSWIEVRRFRQLAKKRALPFVDHRRHDDGNDRKKIARLFAGTRQAAARQAELHELEDCGAIVPVNPDADAAAQTFSADYLVLARTACRLRNDFELDTQGLAVALALLDRVRSLETELRDLRAQLPALVR